jgi:hypothetical protein
MHRGVQREADADLYALPDDSYSNVDRQLLRRASASAGGPSEAVGAFSFSFFLFFF